MPEVKRLTTEGAERGAERQRIVLELLAPPGQLGLAAVRRLLKFAWRVLGLKCTSVRIRPSGQR
jgi:hypothetical protein